MKAIQTDIDPDGKTCVSIPCGYVSRSTRPMAR